MPTPTPTQIQTWFDLQSKVFIANAKVISKEEVGQDYFFRLDNKTPPPLVPRMPASAGQSEDVTTPRVCVGTTLMGCISSISRTFDDFKYPTYKSESFKGGYELSIIKYDYALKVKPKLVFDVEKTNEHWLCAITPETKEYKPKTVGKFFIAQATITPTGAKAVEGFYGHKRIQVTSYLEVNEDYEININDTTKVGIGFYRLEYDDYEFESSNRDKLQMAYDCPVSVSAVDKAEYYAAKKLSAANLNFPIPKSLSW